MSARKVLALILLLLTLGSIFMFRGEFTDQHSFVGEESKNIFKDDYKPSIAKEYIDAKGTKEFRQDFTAMGDRLSMVGVVFKCANADNRAGTMTASICDKDGNVLAKSDVDILQASSRHLVPVYFNDSPGGICKVKKGETYTLVLNGTDIKSDVEFAIFNAKHYDGIYAATVYSSIKWKVIGLYAILIIIAMLLVIFVAGGTSESVAGEGRHGRGMLIRRNADNAALRCMFVLTPFLCYILVTKVQGLKSVDCVKSMMTFAGLMNLSCICCIWLLTFLICNRKKAAVILTTLINMAFTLVNFALIQFRGAPFLFNDVLEIRTAMQVASSYKLELDQYALSTVILSMIWISLAVALKEDKKLGLKARAVVLLITAAALGGLYNTIFVGDTLGDHDIKLSGWDPLRSYTKNGYYLSFAMSVRQARAEKPEGYSLDKVRSIASEYQSDEAVPVTKTTKKTPNVIAIMNESFSDMEIFGDIDTNEEVLAFFNSLKKDTIRGTMHSSVYGGHTAQTEFEFLTGDTDMFMPLNSIAYSSAITRETPAMAWQMKSRNYGGNIAFHPGYADSYNRNNVYPLLGFDKHIASEDMTEPVRVRNFISDKADYDRLISEFEEYRKGEKNRPFYMFNVTIQNHGGFSEDSGIVEPHQIDIEDGALQFEELGQFLNLMKISDQELEKLINYFRDLDEPTVIVLFGDHQPKVESEFYETMYSRKDGLTDLEKDEMKYRVPFIIWANYDIKEKENVEISANFLQTYLMETINAPMTGYQKFQADLMKDVPVISNNCKMDKDGNLYAADEATPSEDKVNEYQIMQYNELYDKKHTVTEFFELKH